MSLTPAPVLEGTGGCPAFSVVTWYKDHRIIASVLSTVTPARVLLSSYLTLLPAPFTQSPRRRLFHPNTSFMPAEE